MTSSFPNRSRSSLPARSRTRARGMHLAGFIAALAAASLVSTAALADAEKDQARLKYRQSLMSGVGANMGAISTILKNRLALPGHVESHARQLAASAKLVSAAFKANVSQGPTDAKSEIWTDWKDFEEKIAAFDDAAMALAGAAAGADPSAVGPAVKTLGESCGGCHKAFRKPKEESYKNQ